MTNTVAAVADAGMAAKARAPKRAGGAGKPRPRAPAKVWGATAEEWALLDEKLRELHEGNQELLKAVRELRDSVG